MANARDKFCTRMRSVSLVMSECSLSGRCQGHVSNFYNVDLENFATASRRYTGDILLRCPQGSVLGPLLFVMYTTPLSTLISSCSLNR